MQQYIWAMTTIDIEGDSALKSLITFLTDYNIFLCVFALLKVVFCMWAFLITVHLSADDAVLQDIAIKTKLYGFITFLKCQIK